ncbi:MAG: putative baseplate assembly protein [Phormidium tanganyikae FI6-MK23]|jgi:photosystem II stability/assembly factor-like uncharacterized protein|nr:putative baseplate assembly protein [Phormidium tanganyikae FI6-MK23]
MTGTHLNVITNRPGLSSLAYRIGDYAAFRKYLLAQLSQELPGLKTRDPDDPAIALLDAWAIVSDVLTFYQERIANEGFLNTATERQSIIELARLIGYELKPGVAASTHLAFAIEDKPGGSAPVVIPLETQVMSIPNEGEVPQIFETSKEILAHPAWNALKPRIGKPQEITRDTHHLYLSSINTQLSAGDLILLLGDEDQEKRLFLLSLVTVEAIVPLSRTLITWDEPLELSAKTLLRNPQVIAFRQRAGLFGNNAPRWESVPNEIKRNAKGIALKGGVFTSAITAGNASWTEFSAGLPNQDILCLLAKSGFLFAGAAGAGIFRRTISGTWEAINAGLTTLNVQTILGIENQQGSFLIGTPNGGVFRSRDNGDNWSAINTGNVRVEKIGEQVKAINTGIPNVVVRSLLAYEIGQTSYTFAGTDDSVYRTTNQGQDWVSDKIPAEVPDSSPYRRLPGLPNRVVYALLHIPEGISGKIQSVDAASKKITVKDTTSTIRVGSTVIVNGQTRVVSAIETTNNNILTLDQKFDASFTDKAFEAIYLTIFAATDRGIYNSTNHGVNWSSAALPDRIVYALTHYSVGSNRYILAGTNQGLWYKLEEAEDWNTQTLSENTIFAISTATQGSQQLAFAVTEQGVFQTLDETWDWKSINQGLTTTELTSIAIAPDLTVYAGARFSGFTTPEAQNNQEQTEWANFNIKENEIALDGLYPKVLKDSWVVLLEQSQAGDSHAAVQVAETVTLQRQDFTLDAKITRILPEPFVESPKRFNLRTTTALIQSESLPLAQESLTVPVQKELIFQDPIWENKFFLNRYTHGLDPGKTLILSGKHIRARVNSGGIYRSKNWKISTQPFGQIVRSLIITEPDNTIYASSETALFRSEDDSATWSQLFDQTEKILCMLTHNRAGIGEIAANENNIVRFTSDRTLEQLQPGDVIFTDNQARTVTRKISDTTLEVDRSFNRDLWQRREYAVSTIFAGTQDGVYRLDTTTQPATLQTLSDSLKNIRTLAVHPSTGQLFAGAETGVHQLAPDRKSWTRISTSEPKLNHVTALSIYATSELLYLFAGTSDAGVFSSTDTGATWKAINTGLTTLEIQCLTLNSKNGSIFVGTAKSGVFRSVDQGKTWHPISVGLTNRNVLSLATNEKQQSLIASTPSGIFRSTDSGNNWTEIQWEHTNRGLTYNSVRSLTSLSFNNTLYLFAGTKSGVFRSKDQGTNWEPVNQGLQNTEIQSLLVQDLKIFAGTQAGLFYSSNRAKTWESISLGVARPNIQTLLASRDFLFAGTAKNGLFRSGDRGQTWIPIGLRKQDIRAIAVSHEQLAIGSYGNGIFLSVDSGRSWKQLLDTRPGAGTISSEGTVVTGDATDFTNEREIRIGDTFEANGQTRTVVQINSQTTLVVDVAFKPALKAGTRYTINTGLTNLYVTAIALVGTNQELFVGTAGSGIFRSQDQGQHWQAMNEGFNPNDLEIRCLSFDPVAHHLFVGTATSGVFRFINRGDRWERLGTKLNDLQTELVNIDVRSILLENSNLYIGGIGILPSPDQLTFVELQSDDLLRVIAAPTSLATNQDAKHWLVLDRNNFKGKLTIASSEDIQLEPATEEDPIVSEICVVQASPDDEERPILALEKPLQYSYDPESVSLYANVVEATHGETIRETLGSGNGALPNQRFVLNKPPLTYTAAATPSGGESTLNVFVNDVEWTEAPSLYPLNKQDQNYVVQIEEDGTIILTFGDGRRGARLPSGQENTTAVYRSGIGLAGQVGVGRISQKKTGPASLLSVTNPLPATGAAPRETLDSARSTVPATTRILDRIVSLQDFEDFTLAFAGIGKAQAIAIWNGEQIVHITIAAVGGETVAQESQLYESLMSAIATVRDPVQRVQVDSFEPIFFKLDARFVIQPNYQVDRVEPAIRQQLLEQFAFERRAFAQPVTQSEVIAAIQSVPGVLAVDLEALHRRDASRTLQATLLARSALWNEQTRQIQPAQLLLLPAANITLTPVQTL